jgi:predicted O-methyltransferase YrrM
METLQALDEDFDLIFNDTKKSSYPNVVPLAAQRLRPGGLLISDNVLWHGRVLDNDPDPDTQAVLEYNRLIFNDPSLFSVILPLRDGIAVSRKL